MISVKPAAIISEIEWRTSFPFFWNWSQSNRNMRDECSWWHWFKWSQTRDHTQGKSFIQAVTGIQLHAEESREASLAIRYTTSPMRNGTLHGGDFNVVQFPNEKRIFCGISSQIAAFLSYIEKNEQMNPTVFREQLTWSNNQEAVVMCRLDRFLISAQFKNMHKDSSKFFFQSISLIVILSFSEVVNCGPKPFYFNNADKGSRWHWHGERLVE